MDFKRNFKGQIGIGFLWEIFAVALTFWIVGFIIFTVLPLLPQNTLLAAQGLTAITNFDKFVFSFVDNSLYVLFMLILFIGLYDAWEKPSRKKAIVDIVGLFILGYFNLAIAAIIPTLSVFTPSIILPLTYTFFNSPYKVVILYFIMIIAIILNVRTKR